MDKKSSKLIKSVLGDDFFESLNKSDVYKQNTRTATNTDDIATGLSIVPRVVMSYLIMNLSNMIVDSNKELHLPFSLGCSLHVVKKDNDSFSGYLYRDGRKISEFENRSIPGVGLVLMTVLELYDVENIEKEEDKSTFDIGKLQNIIDERLQLHHLIGRVVDQKIAQRDAIEILIKERLSLALTLAVPVEVKKETKADKLKSYIEKNKIRQEEIKMGKSETLHCPDCGSGLYEGGKNITLCICYGEDWNKTIKIQKSESGIKMKFPKTMDAENIQMLLTNLKQRNKD